MLLVAVTAVGLAVAIEAADPPSRFESALADLAASVPDTLDVVWQAFAGAQVAWAAAIVLLTALRRRVDLLRDLLLAAVGAGALAVVIDDVWLGGSSSGLWDALRAVGPPPQEPSARLAVVVATTVVASPHLTRPFRRLSRWSVALGTASLVVLEATTPTGAALGLLCGTMSAALVHLLVGTAAGLPSLGDVSEALLELGIDAGRLRDAPRQTAGVFAAEATGADGADLLVRVYGRDAWGSQLLATTWRNVSYRDVEMPTLTRLHQAEHEAFTTLLAERSGVPVHPVISAGVDASDDALIVLRRRGRPIDEGEGPVDPEVLAAVWDTVSRLHDAGLTHRDLAPDQFRLDGSAVVLGGLDRAVVSPTVDQRRCDEAQLFVTSVLLGGLDATIAIALDERGPDGVEGFLPYLQVPALGPSLRAALRRTDLDLDDVRDAVAAASGIEAPAPAKLRRVSRSALVQAALLSLGAYFLLSSLAGIDFAEVWDEVQDAAWPLLVVALVLGQTPRLAQAESARGACPRPVAYGPLAQLQFAITFINLVLPSTAARVATNVRFFQRQGIPPAAAVSIGVVDSLGGFAVQVVILTSALLFGDLALEVPTDDTAGDGSVLAVLAVIAVAAVLAGLAALLLPPIRRRIRTAVAPRVAEIRDTVGSLRSPRKLAQVLGGNAAAELLFASTLAVVLSAVHAPVPLGTLLVINVCVSLFAGLMPVPGGIGVTEGALIFGLTAAGVDDATAFAATICYRLITFYLPPIWGGVVFHRMERTGLL